MPDLPSRGSREKELAVALLLVFEQSRNSLVVSAERVADTLKDPLRQTFLDAVRGLSKLAPASAPIPSSDDIEAEADRWAREFSVSLGQEIADSTRDLVSQTDDIDAVFGAARAEMVAITEVTRAISVAETWLLLFWLDAGFEARERTWHTEQDGKVCPVCRPLDGTPEVVWVGTSPAGPPAHPNCRCWLDYQVS